MSTSTQETNDGMTVVEEPHSHWHRPLRRRSMFAGIASFGIAAGLGASQVLAQDATPAADDQSGADQEDDALDLEGEIGAAYQNFVGKLATNLGEEDPTVVDTGIREALKAMVDEKYDAGEISRNLADAIKERLDTAESPLGVAMLGGLRAHRIERRRNRRKDRRDDWPGEDDDTTTDLPSLDGSLSI